MKVFAQLATILVCPLLVFCAIGEEKNESEPTLIRQAEVMSSTATPGKDGKKTSVWTIKKTDLIRVNLVEMIGEVRRHIHPDADHSLMVLKGRVKVEAGSLVTDMNEGDFISIPKGVPHKYIVYGESALLVSMDAPYYDPEKSIQLEE